MWKLRKPGLYLCSAGYDKTFKAGRQNKSNYCWRGFRNLKMFTQNIFIDILIL